jgi:hypothetical protein
VNTQDHSDFGDVAVDFGNQVVDAVEFGRRSNKVNVFESDDLVVKV